MPILTIGDEFPSYQMKAVRPGDLLFIDAYQADDYFEQVDSTFYQERWRVVFFWPKNFSFVCPTEITAFSKVFDEFHKRDCDIIGVTTDCEYSTYAWRRTHRDLRYVPFPLAADITRELSVACGVLNSSGICDRATFIIDPDNIIRFVSVADSSVGRSVNEVLRQIDALQSNALCVADWRLGMPGINDLDVMRR